MDFVNQILHKDWPFAGRSSISKQDAWTKRQTKLIWRTGLNPIHYASMPFKQINRAKATSLPQAVCSDKVE